MAYELHITRADEYFDSEEHPITFEEWLQYADANPALTIGGRLNSGVGLQPIYEFTCSNGDVVSMTWFEGAIEIKGHFEGIAFREFGDIVGDLQANLLGDDGERYTASGVQPPLR
ncbi:hypothetical protein AB0B97_00345 [Micromonospora sp. NPDC049004]|uniref:hypothetical protein n=1 Tax=Micromonospora sp. NPDC049004 TaxID=3154348 RepID=UPI0033F787AC